MDNRKISICIPTYNRYEMTIESFAQVLNDDRIKEVVIIDDDSQDGSYGKLWEHFENEAKVFVSRNIENLDCYKNKAETLSVSDNEWVILLDSDNIITPDYLDKIFAIEEWEEKTIYAPTFASPHFDYRQFDGVKVDRNNVKEYLHNEVFLTALNTANFFVNRETYLKAFNPDIDPVTSDSIYMAYRLLEQGNSYYFVPGLEYEHRVHSGSHYQNNVSKTPVGFHQEVINKLNQL